MQSSRFATEPHAVYFCSTPEPPVITTLPDQLVQGADVYAEGSCFRIIKEPTVIRPNKGAYGVPYDLVATGTGTAIQDMLAKMRDADISLEL